MQQHERRTGARPLIGDPHPVDVDVLHTSILPQTPRIAKGSRRRGLLEHIDPSRRGLVSLATNLDARRCLARRSGRSPPVGAMHPDRQAVRGHAPSKIRQWNRSLG